MSHQNVTNPRLELVIFFLLLTEVILAYIRMTHVKNTKTITSWGRGFVTFWWLMGISIYIHVYTYIYSYIYICIPIKLVGSWHVSPVRVRRLTHMCDLTHSHVWCDVFMIVTLIPSLDDTILPYAWLVGISIKLVGSWQDLPIYVTWLTHNRHANSLTTRVSHMHDMTHSHVRGDMTRAHVWRDSLICVTWLTHMCDMICLYTWYDSLR